MDGLDDDHVRALAETEEQLPPILVQSSSLRIIDGFHRVRAAVLRGETDIEAHLFDGDDRSAFVAAVEANIAHGLPLSLADREAAATRILTMFPDWSDRAVAKVSGLSDKTVGSIRLRSTADIPQLARRQGIDGRFRPADPAAARRRAVTMLTEDPRASLRSVARAVGISPATVRDVRDKMRQGVDPVHPQRRGDKTHGGRSRLPDMTPSELSRLRIMRSLMKDPSLRLNDAGRELLRWMELHARLPENRDGLVERIPPHCAETVALLALECAAWWNSLARQIEAELPEP